MQSLFRNLIPDYRHVQAEVARKVKEMDMFNDILKVYSERIYRAVRLAENTDGTYPVDYAGEDGNSRSGCS